MPPKRRLQLSVVSSLLCFYWVIRDISLWFTVWHMNYSLRNAETCAHILLCYYKYCLGNFCGSTLYTLGAAQRHVQSPINYLERIRVVIMSHGTSCCHKQTRVDPVTFSSHSEVFCEVICPIRCIFLLMVSLNFPLSPSFFFFLRVAGKDAKERRRVGVSVSTSN